MDRLAGQRAFDHPPMPPQPFIRGMFVCAMRTVTWRRANARRHRAMSSGVSTCSLAGRILRGVRAHRQAGDPLPIITTVPLTE
jgi:hypothetical protein